MKITLDFAVKAALALLVLGIAAWIVVNTEWVEEEVPTPLRGEAEQDPLYAAKQVLRQLGATVVAPPNFDRLPPPGATLVLASSHWSMFPGRAEALRRWVESGGHLVIDDLMLAEDKVFGWIPIRRVPKPGAAGAAGAPAASSAASAPLLRRPQWLPPSQRVNCPELAEPDDMAGAFGPPRKYRVCGAAGVRTLSTAAPVLWSLNGPHGAEFLRVPVGRGAVTADTGYSILGNLEVLRADHALTAVAALRLREGDEVWFVTSEKRPPLLAVIWESGAPAVLLAALLLALALWRGAVRFGPRAPGAALARRSVAEQIRGTAHFIWQRNGNALLRAQLRALDEAARGRVHQHERLDRRARAEAIARITALDADALSRAMDPSIKRRRGELPHTLALLESARRRLMSR
jgi:hypothetical protein